MARALLFLFSIALAGCGQEIVVVQCDGHVADDVDGGARDGGRIDDELDGGVVDGGERDGGERDGGERDGGADACGAAPYCITALVPSAGRVPVRTPVTFTAEIDNPGGAALAFTVDEAAIVATRRAGVPPLVPSDIAWSLTVDASGVATFQVSEVPTWYAATTFTIRVEATAPGGPVVAATADVVVDGNVVFADLGAVFAVASDGLPARSVNFTQGRFLEGDSFVRTPTDVLMLRDGSLLVQDRGTDPQSLKRFELSGENVLLGSFETDEAGTPFLDTENGLGMAQLDDGRIVVIDERIGRTPTTRFVVYREDGIYERAIVPTTPSERYDGIAAGPNGSFLVGATLGRRIVQYAPDSGTAIGDFATEVVGISALTRAQDGSYYVGSSGTIVRLSATGARMMINGLPDDGSTDWEFLAPFGSGRVLASRRVTSAYLNVTAIEGVQSLGWFRQENANPVRSTYGIAYLE